MTVRFSWIAFLIILFTMPLYAPAQNVAWLPAIHTAEEFNQLTVDDTSRADLLRTGKYTTPAKEDPSLLQTVYQNVNRYPLHLDFLVHEFPERFGGLTQSEYLDLVYWRTSRQYYSGSISRFRDAEGQILYGFDIYADNSEPPQPDEVSKVYRQLSRTMTLRPFAYSPKTPLTIEQAREWKDPGFPIYLPGGFVTPNYEVYSQAQNYGRIRLFTLSDFQDAMNNGEIGWQDIVVIDTAPTDVSTVVAGIITGTRQGELSHVNVRSLRRGTPNAFVKDALQQFAPYSNQLVKLSLDADQYEITTPVDLTEAESWWNAHRPMLPPLPRPDDAFSEIVSLPELARTPDRNILITRFGGKAAGLATLYSFLEMAYQVDGFAIPFHYYVEFMQSNTVRDPQNPFQTISFEKYIYSLLENPRFRSDTAYRRAQLEQFQHIMRTTGVVDPKLVEKLIEKITEVYGSTEIKVRFRSSSNAEDDVAFNGAGLYDSTSVCAQDTLDGDDEGPSHCQADIKNERTIERGLKKVWASLWNPRAYEEREYFQIDHKSIRMGILVTRAFPNEDSQGVAFTGDPVAGLKTYYVINVQKGDESVVQPDTGVTPEKDILYLTDGQVTDIHRARGSSLLPEGEWVLAESQLHQLGEVLYQMEQNMPVDPDGYSPDQIYLDVEFKYDKGNLFIKQVRPTLMASVRPPSQNDYVTLNIPPQTQVVGVFQEGRSLRREYEYLSAITFSSGDYPLPLAPGRYPLDIIDRFEFRPDRAILAPLTHGSLTVTQSGDPANCLNYKFEQDFDADGKTLSLSIDYLSVGLTDGKPDKDEIIFDEPFLSQQLYMLGKMQVGVRIDFLEFASATYASLPLYQVEFTLEDGQVIRLYQRWQPPMAGTGPANLVYADVDIQEGHVTQADYWRLVYAADHHNWNERYWVLFDSPIGETYGVAAFSGESPYDWQVYTLDQDLTPLRYLEVESVHKEPIDHLPPVAVNDWAFHMSGED